MIPPGSEIQIDNGEYVRIHQKILEVLAVAKLAPLEFRCVFFLLRKTYGWNKKEDVISLSQFIEGTGASRQAVQDALTNLLRLQVIYRNPHGKQAFVYGFNKYIETWLPESFESRHAGNGNRFHKDKPTSLPGETSQPTETSQPGDTGTSLPTETGTSLPGETHKRQLKTPKDSIANSPAEPEPESTSRPRRQRKPKERTPEEQATVDRQKDIMTAYRDVLGYPVTNEAQENTGAKTLAKAGYSSGQVRACYEAMKAESFWDDKHLSLTSLAKQIGAKVGPPCGMAPTNGTGTVNQALPATPF